MTTLPIHAKVECTDGHCGELVAVIVNPVQQQVTHLVVRDKDEQYLAPLKHVGEMNAHAIRLCCSRNELQKMESFVEKCFIRSEHPETPHSMAYPFPLGTPLYHTPYAVPAETNILSMQIEHVPKGEMAIHRGEHVEATDGIVGHVSELLMDQDGSHITHLVVQSRKFLRKRTNTVPIAAIDHFENDAIYLNVDKHAIVQRPASPG